MYRHQQISVSGVSVSANLCIRVSVSANQPQGISISMNNVQCIYHTMHPSPLEEGTSSKAHQELCGEAVQVREGFQKDRTPLSGQIS